MHFRCFSTYIIKKYKEPCITFSSFLSEKQHFFKHISQKFEILQIAQNSFENNIMSKNANTKIL